MRKWAQPELSDIENDHLNESMKLAKSNKTAKFDLLRTFRTFKNDI